MNDLQIPTEMTEVYNFRDVGEHFVAGLRSGRVDTVQSFLEPYVIRRPAERLLASRQK